MTTVSDGLLSMELKNRESKYKIYIFRVIKYFRSNTGKSKF